MPPFPAKSSSNTFRMDTRAAQADPGDNHAHQPVHGGHQRISSIDSQATAVEDGAQLVLDGDRPPKRTVDEDDDDDNVPEAKRLGITAGTAAEPASAQTGPSEPAALQAIPNVTAAAPAVVADPTQHARQPARQVDGGIAAYLRLADVVLARPRSPPIVPGAARIAAVNSLVSPTQRATPAQVAAQKERQRQETEFVARVEDIARRCLPVKFEAVKLPPATESPAVTLSAPEALRSSTQDSGRSGSILENAQDDEPLRSTTHSHQLCTARCGRCFEYDEAPCPCCGVGDEARDDDAASDAEAASDADDRL